jgi:hypothetical protein
MRVEYEMLIGIPGGKNAVGAVDVGGRMILKEMLKVCCSLFDFSVIRTV